MKVVESEKFIKQDRRKSEEELREIVSTCIARRPALVDRYLRVLESFIDIRTSKNVLRRYINLISSLIYRSDNVIFELQPDVSDALLKEVQDGFYREGVDVILYDLAKLGELWGFIGLRVEPRKDGVKFRPVFPFDILFYYPDLEMDDDSQVLVYVLRMGRDEYEKRFGKVSIPDRTVSPFSRFFDVVGATDELTRITDLNPNEYYEVYEVWYKDPGEGSCYVATLGLDYTIRDHFKSPFVSDHPFAFYVPSYLPGNIYGFVNGEQCIPAQEGINDIEEQLPSLVERLAYPPVILKSFQGLLTREDVVNELRKPSGVVLVDSPDMAVEEVVPKIDPGVLSTLSDRYERNILDTIGISEIMLGHSAKNVRSYTHALLASQFSSSEVIVRALKFEQFIERVMTLYAMYKVLCTDKFPLLAKTPLRVEVYAHTTSPVLLQNFTTLVLELNARGLIPPEVAIELLPIPHKDRIKVMIQRAREAAFVQEAKEREEGK